MNGSAPDYGNLNFGHSATNTTISVATGGLSQHAIFFVSPSNYTLNGNGFTFYDYSGYPSSYDQLRSSGAVTLGGNLVVNSAGPFANGTVFDLVGGTSLTGTYAGIDNNGFYTFGGQTFQAEYTGTDFELVAVPEPATWFAESSWSQPPPSVPAVACG